MVQNAAVSLRIVNNQRVMRAAFIGLYRDLGGALLITSEAPIEDWNCLEGFITDDANVDSLLDEGFSLLRTLDRQPAVYLTPLDQPPTLAARLRDRGLVEDMRRTTMVFRGRLDGIATNADVRVERAGRQNAATFARVFAEDEAEWVEPFVHQSVLASLDHLEYKLYLGFFETRAVGTGLLVCDGPTAGLYYISTLKAYRRLGVASTLIAHAIRDARESGCDLVALEALRAGDAQGLYLSLGFEPVHESMLWVQRWGA